MIARIMSHGKWIYLLVGSILVPAIVVNIIAVDWSHVTTGGC